MNQAVVRIVRGMADSRGREQAAAAGQSPWRYAVPQQPNPVARPCLDCQFIAEETQAAVDASFQLLALTWVELEATRRELRETEAQLALARQVLRWLA